MNISRPVLSNAFRRIALLVVFAVGSLRFGLAQINSHVELKKLASEGIESIDISWTKTDQQNWESQNEGRLEYMGVKTNIQSGSLSISNQSSSFQFSLPENIEIEALLNIQELSTDEKLSLVDRRSGEIVYEIPHLEHHNILTPVFDPATTYLVWSGPQNQSRQSIFTIETIYLHNQDQKTERAIGFGTALPCHPNAACKQDSILKLISNSTVRIRMVMDEGIGWCSGSFINNTRNDKSPLVLTAYHCTFQFTPQYDLWRFDLQYKSDSCTNPLLEPTFFSLTGCELKASGQGSDFLLVKLQNDVPVNQEVTFAGWNRDDQAVPDTLYLVHHPNADIRKLSTCTSGAVIYPNPIGWNEGYTTPANHHFRFKFTEGGHQPGSSGGPVFNKDGLIVAQLHGGSMGCEDSNTAFSGRLAKSWSYGLTPHERLSDWLDPDGMGDKKIPSIENFQKNELINIEGLVKDPIGRPVKNAQIIVSGSYTDTLMTDNNGQFTLSSFNRQGQYTFTPKKNDYPTNGLNVLDLVAIQKHLLGKDTFDFPWQFIAADATNNTIVSVGDIIVVLRLLLGKISYFPSSPSWRFDPPTITLDHLPEGMSGEVQFQAIKIGDLNNSVDPLK